MGNKKEDWGKTYMITDFEGTALRIKNGKLFILDQRLLPNQEKWIRVKSVNQAILLIKDLAVRGAPLIGVFAALSLAMVGSWN